jgi:hypothetical protein
MYAIFVRDVRHLCPGWRISRPGIGSVFSGVVSGVV